MNENLIAPIKERVSHGVSKEDIKKDVMEMGYSEEEFESAFSQVDAGSGPEAQKKRSIFNKFKLYKLRKHSALSMIGSLLLLLVVGPFFLGIMAMMGMAYDSPPADTSKIDFYVRLSISLLIFSFLWLAFNLFFKRQESKWYWKIFPIMLNIIVFGSMVYLGNFVFVETFHSKGDRYSQGYLKCITRIDPEEVYQNRAFLYTNCEFSSVDKKYNLDTLYTQYIALYPNDGTPASKELIEERISLLKEIYVAFNEAGYGYTIQKYLILLLIFSISFGATFFALYKFGRNKDDLVILPLIVFVVLVLCLQDSYSRFSYQLDKCFMPKEGQQQACGHASYNTAGLEKFAAIDTTEEGQSSSEPHGIDADTSLLEESSDPILVQRGMYVDGVRYSKTRGPSKYSEFVYFHPEGETYKEHTKEIFIRMKVNANTPYDAMMSQYLSYNNPDVYTWNDDNTYMVFRFFSSKAFNLGSYSIHKFFYSEPGVVSEIRYYSDKEEPDMKFPKEISQLELDVKSLYWNADEDYLEYMQSIYPDKPLEVVRSIMHCNPILNKDKCLTQNKLCDEVVDLDWKESCMDSFGDDYIQTR